MLDEQSLSLVVDAVSEEDAVPMMLTCTTLLAVGRLRWGTCASKPCVPAAHKKFLPGIKCSTMLASPSRLQWALKCLGYQGISIDAFQLAASRGLVDIMKSVRTDASCPWRAFDTAAEGGHTEAMSYLYPDIKETCDLEYHLDVTMASGSVGAVQWTLDTLLAKRGDDYKICDDHLRSCFEQHSQDIMNLVLSHPVSSTADLSCLYPDNLSIEALQFLSSNIPMYFEVARSREELELLFYPHGWRCVPSVHQGAFTLEFWFQRYPEEVRELAEEHAYYLNVGWNLQYSLEMIKAINSILPSEKQVTMEAQVFNIIGVAYENLEYLEGFIDKWPAIVVQAMAAYPGLYLEMLKKNNYGGWAVIQRLHELKVVMQWRDLGAIAVQRMDLPRLLWCEERCLEEGGSTFIDQAFVAAHANMSSSTFLHLSVRD